MIKVHASIQTYGPPLRLPTSDEHALIYLILDLGRGVH